MTRTLTRLATVAATVVLGAATVGCGFLTNVGNAVSNLTDVADLSDKLTKSAELTYTAEYRLTDGSGTATVVQQPPNVALLGKNGRFILTSEALLICTGSGAKATCQRTPNSSGEQASADQAGYLSAVAGGGFVSTPMAVTLMGAASVVPGVQIDKSDKEVAGLDSTCLHATGIDQETGDTGINLAELTVCVGDNGVLTAFSGVGTDGSKVGVELARYSDTVDATAFAAPKGAKVVDVSQLSTG